VRRTINRSPIQLRCTALLVVAVCGACVADIDEAHYTSDGRDMDAIWKESPTIDECAPNRPCETRDEIACTELGYESGTATCRECEWDIENCTGAVCGDYRLDGDEECDDAEHITPCPAERDGPATYVYCGGDCRPAVGDCTWCGDGELNGGEICDPSVDIARLCTRFDGFFGDGRARCSNECTWDMSDCREVVCGDGRIEHDEICEPGIDGRVRYEQCPYGTGEECRVCGGCKNTFELTLGCGDGSFSSAFEECDASAPGNFYRPPYGDGFVWACVDCHFTLVPAPSPAPSNADDSKRGCAAGGTAVPVMTFAAIVLFATGGTRRRIR
jgi:hypothetical protein